MKNRCDLKVFYKNSIKQSKKMGVVLTEFHSCSKIYARVFTLRKISGGVVYSKKSPEGGQVPFMHGIGTCFPFWVQIRSKK